MRRRVLAAAPKIGATAASAAIAAIAALALPAAAAPAGGEEALAAGGAQPASRWHGSTLSFDQSATTQTFGVGADYQSSNPVYEWWFALRPRYYVFERARDSLNVNLWANLYWELTDSDTTTRLHELLLGPTYLSASYARVLRERETSGGSGEWKTSVSAGPRLVIPTDKAARDSGQILGVGATVGASQTFPLRGKGKRLLQGGRLGLVSTLTHPFVRSQSPVNSDIHQLRQDLTENLIVSDVLRGPMNTRYLLALALSGELQVMRRLELSASYVLLERWVYPVSNDPVAAPTGPIVPMGVADPQTFGVTTWLTAALGYELMDQMTVSLGYYNLANQIGPDGKRRSPLWSPNARAFLTLTGNLDVIYDGVRRKVRPKASGAASSGPTP